ncbi:lipase member K-like [Galendromus occidentalis]|uniref:Lipase member K-like n=1 Tax=Galendromus occidentalis TaxID=34638 RepID=A0AAJ6QNU5_9ACAR|nr:lipase member K-like [Galendromus occidentalis]
MPKCFQQLNSNNICSLPRCIVVIVGVGLIRKHRYPVEHFPVLTKDGFLLSLVRIPLSRGIPRSFKTEPGPPVLLVHGIISSADDWVLNTPQNSPGFLLSDAGYDVWLINTRGTPYSKHLKHRRNSKQFWDFSFDEIGNFDIPAAIDFVLHHTGHPQLTILGWSQGTTDIMVTLSLKPQYNHKVKLFVAMAPVANITHLASPMTMLIPFKGLIKKTLDLYNGGGVLPSSRHSRSMYNHMCNSHIRGLCFLPVSVSVGISPHQLNKTRIPVYMAHMPSGTSTKNLIHFVQIRDRREFRRFDYGEPENLWRYGLPFPPKYPLHKISTPMALFWGEGDRLATPQDVSTLRRELRHTIVFDYLVPQSGFAHLDFTIGINAKEVLHDPVLHVINEFNKGLHLGLYRPEIHDTLFEAPVPPFPMPPMTHKNPSGLPIMGIKVASIAMGKPWHQDDEFPPMPHKPLSFFEFLRPPSLDPVHRYHFAGETFAHFDNTMLQGIPEDPRFGSSHGFGSSPPRYALTKPMFAPHRPNKQPGIEIATQVAQNHVEEPPVNYMHGLRPPPPVRNVAKPTVSPEVTPDVTHDLQDISQELPDSSEGESNIDEPRQHLSKLVPAEGHFIDYGLSTKPIAMHPDKNGGFQTDWFPITGNSKKLNVQDLMPSASKAQLSPQLLVGENSREMIKSPASKPLRAI